ncbi:MAG: bifunctional hydroxymethylpyrimidine kinase/phosphomethylpyrimidine kinase [Syntrophales bacterium]
MSIKKILTIAGSDSGGGAGIQADLKTIAALGCHGMTVVTALTAQNTRGVQGIFEVPASFIEKQFDSVASDIGIDAAKTGMLAGPETLRTIIGKIREFRIEKLVVDPVMIAKGGASLITDEAKEILKNELLPLSLVVTPNIPEAEFLSKKRISSVEDMKKSAEIIRSLGPRNVLVKGGHLAGDAVDILYDGTLFHEFRAERIATADTHGTGCTLSAAIAAGVGKGLPVLDAAREAKEYLTASIRSAIRLGGGHGPVNPMAVLFREADRYRCIRELADAVRILKESKCGNLIPEVQSNIGYALPFAARPEEVAAIPGRLIRVGDELRTIRDPSFGVSSHIARIILTVMRYDESRRSAMNIRYSEEIVRICGELGYDVASFSRYDEPDRIKKAEGSSLEWGTDSVLAGRDTVPDIIFDRGDVGKEPMVRILGKNPGEVVKKALSIASRLNH